MSFPSAYSLELKTDLSAKEAYDFSRAPVGSSHHLTDAKKFQCGKKCSFKLTLANFNNPDFNKTPYFTPGARNQEHDPENCQRMVEHYQQREQEVTIENHGSFSREKNKLIIDLDLVKGSLAIVTKPRQKNENTPSSETSHTEVVHRHSRSSSTVDNKTFRSHIKQLTALIRYFLEYQSGEKYTFYSKNKQEIQLEKYFVNLSETDQRGINLEDVHIYYDTASVISKTFELNPEKDYFLIIFNSECTLDGTSSHPTITINKRLASHHGVKGKLKTLERAAKDKQPLKLFYFGKFRKHSSNKYINPDVGYEEILDYLVIS
ncbi:hypothetical protein FMV2238Y02_03240 [Streptococcus canis]|uniref:Uncharacterized protein n=1 Tax=Streptococcus canis TaxID=1329 RepID=A0A2D4DQ96_STRCB|nr:hypothetical protein [Streptococcus canis]GAY70619.1 uncharacterized protein TANIYAMA4_1038 [Streptococcus canis]GFK30067.1 hypothetical protein ScFU149_01840 [Streptococcus canis]VDC41907.1 hypothetical protein FMV2238Y02_03240 [Streptococcus canis]HEP2810631.1 hypothetical protein [Streptococcus pyogenes]